MNTVYIGKTVSGGDISLKYVRDQKNVELKDHLVQNSVISQVERLGF